MISLKWYEWLLHSAIGSLLTLLLACPAGATHPTYYFNGQYYYTPYVAPAVKYDVKRVVQIEYYPAFPIGYAAPYSAPAPQASTTPHGCDAKVAALDAKIAALEAKLAGAKPEGGVPPDALPSKVPPEKVKYPALTQHCAGCHNKDVADAKGGKLALFENGVPLTWDDETAGRVLKALASGKMPKGGKLTQEQFASVAQEVFDLNGK